jgi:hypothetical protein
VPLSLARPWRWRHYNPSKHRELRAQSHSITSPKIYSLNIPHWLWNPTIWVGTGAFSPGVKLPTCKAGHSPPSSSEWGELYPYLHTETRPWLLPYISLILCVCTE